MKTNGKQTFGAPSDKVVKGVVLIAVVSIIGVYLGHWINQAVGYDDVGVIPFTTAFTVLIVSVFVMKKISNSH